MAIYKNTPPIVTNGLVLCLDAGSRMSYVSGSLNWNDLSRGTTISGSLTNGPIFDSTYQGSIVFDGVDDFVTFGTPPQLQFTNAQSFTISSWINWTTVGTGGTFIFAYNLSSTGRGYYLGLDGGAFGLGTNVVWFDYFDSTAFKGIQSPANTMVKGVWCNVVATVSSTTNTAAGLNLYLNGIRIPPTTRGGSSSPSSINYSGLVAQIGARVGTTPIKGNVSQFTIYNTELSPQEIAQNYNALKSRFGLT